MCRCFAAMTLTDMPLLQQAEAAGRRLIHHMRNRPQGSVSCLAAPLGLPQLLGRCVHGHAPTSGLQSSMFQT